MSSTLISRRSALAGFAALPLAAQAQTSADQPEFYPIPVELLAGVDAIQGKVTFGSPQADVRLYEFFDYNCGFCRQTARDIRPLLAANKDMAITLVHYAVLGIPSIQAHRIALAFSRQKPKSYLEFHEKLYEVKGVKTDEPALAIALKLGADKAQLLKDADSEAVTQAMMASARLGETLGFRATPSFILGKEGYSGFLSLKQTQGVIDAYRKTL